MSKVLVVKGNFHEGPERLSLDRVCNGLLSWARARGLSLANDSEVGALVLLRPIAAEFERVYWWLDESKPFPWAQVPTEAASQIFWNGRFNANEITKGKSTFPSLEEWQPAEPPRLRMD